MQTKTVTKPHASPLCIGGSTRRKPEQWNLALESIDTLTGKLQRQTASCHILPNSGIDTLCIRMQLALSGVDLDPVEHELFEQSPARELHAYMIQMHAAH